ncbi:MAG: POTRA domain-containing protein [Steroidobacteraceae bacterium]
MLRYLPWFMSGLIALHAGDLFAQTASKPSTGVEAPAGATARPVVDEITFKGNTKISSNELRKLVQLQIGREVSGSLIAPELERLMDAYKGKGGALVAPDVQEIKLNHLRVVFQVFEGGTAQVPVDDRGVPLYLYKYFGNTLICAAAGTSNDLCHTWMYEDGRMIQIDSNGAHTAHWVVGPVLADGRVPICQYWDTGRIVMPAELRAYTGLRWPAGNVCTTENYKTVCRNYDDLSKESADTQRKGMRDMAQRFQEEGVCYPHGEHEVGTAWFEYGTPLPGQLGMDREILIPGHQ